MDEERRKLAEAIARLLQRLSYEQLRSVYIFTLQKTK